MSDPHNPDVNTRAHPVLVKGWNMLALGAALSIGGIAVAFLIYHMNLSCSLRAALIKSQDEKVVWLVRQGAYYRPRSSTGVLMAKWAVRKNDLATLEQLIQNGVDVNGSDGGEYTPLMEAVARRNLQAAKMLLKSGADCLSADYDGVTPLLLAISLRDDRMVKLLLQRNAALQLSGYRRRLAYRLAAQSPRTMVILRNLDRD